MLGDCVPGERVRIDDRWWFVAWHWNSGATQLRQVRDDYTTNTKQDAMAEMPSETMAAERVSAAVWRERHEHG